MAIFWGRAPYWCRPLKLSHVMRLWYFSSSVNSVIKRACAAIQSDVLVGTFVYFHTSCMWTAKALASLRGCAGSPESSLFAYVISTITSWAVSNSVCDPFPLGVLGWMWKSIVTVPDHCLFSSTRHYQHIPYRNSLLSLIELWSLILKAMTDGLILLLY